MKVFTTIISLMIVGAAIIGMRLLGEARQNPEPEASASTRLVARSNPVQSNVPLSDQSTHDFEPLDVPGLANRRVLYASGLPNGNYRAIAVDDG